MSNNLTQWLHFQPVKRKILWVIMVIVMTTVAAISGFMYWHTDQQHRQDFIRNNLTLVKLVGDYTALPLVFDDKKGANEQLSKLLQDPRIVYLSLRNAKGEILAQFDPFNYGTDSPLLDESREWRWHHDRLYFRVPISHNNKHLGVLSGAFTVDEYLRAQRLEQGFILAAVLLAVLCSFVMAVLLTRYVMSSIRQLEMHARRIAQQPGLDEPIAYPERRNDEISHLYQAFNLLMKEVRNREMEILQLNADLESKIKQRTEDLSAALKIKSAFLANMSHEIRTPMNAILGMHQLVLETELTPRQFNYLTKADNAAKWLLGIINDVLDYSKLEAGKIRLELADFKLESVMRYLEDVARPLLRDKPVTLHFVIANNVPKVLRGDELRIGQILLNLLSNAIKFTEAGAITVQIRLLGIDAEHARVRFSVTDTGIGISEAQQQTLFNAFTQADSSTTRKFGGTGLGLAICRDLASAMGSYIEVKSGLGIGSCFSFNLDIELAKGTTSDSAPVVNAPLTRPEMQGHVLLVEDNLINQELMLEVLRAHGLIVDLAQNGLEAIALVEQNHYDVVLMDCQMPVMDGYIATRKIRENPRCAELPIIAMTANVMAEDREKCLACGMNDHIGKPIDWDLLFHMLARWMAKTASGEGGVNNGPVEVRPAGVDKFSTPASVDQALAESLVAGDGALYRQLLGLTRFSHSHDLINIKSLYRVGDLRKAAEAAHTLSGALSAIGAIKLAELLKNIQNHFDQGASDCVTLPLLKQAETEFNQLVLEIDQLLQLSPDAGPLERTLPQTLDSQGIRAENAVSAPKATLDAAVGGRILLVEDNALNREVVTEILMKAGFQVTVANNGQEAVELVKAQRYAAILMDIHMPVLDGFEATRQIRLLPSGEDIPIIAVTAATTDSRGNPAFTDSMNGHIDKPIEPRQLLEVLTKVLGGKPENVTFPRNQRPAASNPAALLAQLEQIALSFEAYEAVPMSRLIAVYQDMETEFPRSEITALAGLIERYDYTGALKQIRAMIEQLMKQHEQH